MLNRFSIVLLLIAMAFLMAACAGAAPAAQNVPDTSLPNAPSEQSDDPPDTASDIAVDDRSREEPEPKADPTPKPAEQQASTQSSSVLPQATQRSDSSQSSTKSLPEIPSEAKAYTWRDGDRTQTVILQPDLVLLDGDAPENAAEVKANTGAGAIVDRDDGQAGMPVFRSISGALMTLPGGVLLVLEPKWTESQVNAFFGTNGIKRESVSELSYATNGFLVETEPGFPSLELANNLAAQEGVIIASPNWWTELSTR